jgi:hypothetical protein
MEMSLLGVYNSREHVITMNGKMSDLSSLAVRISEYIKIHEEIPTVAHGFLRTDSYLSKYVGIKSMTVTLVHEFGHALRGDQHNSSNAHGEWSYGVDEWKFVQSYNRE